MTMKYLKTLLAGALALACLCALAQEATIRKNFAERLPQLKKIDEISATPVPGIYEVRVNEAELYYTDAEGNFLIEGNLIDLRQRRNLTEERIAKLTALNFNELPVKDAFTIVRGNGKRTMQCLDCDRPDPLKTGQTTGWLKGELQPPT